MRKRGLTKKSIRNNPVAVPGMTASFKLLRLYFQSNYILQSRTCQDAQWLKCLASKEDEQFITVCDTAGQSDTQAVRWLVVRSEIVTWEKWAQ